MIIVTAIILVFMSVAGLTYSVLKVEKKSTVRLGSRKEKPEGKAIMYLLMPIIKRLSGINERIGYKWFDGMRSRIKVRLEKAGKPYELKANDFLALKEFSSLVLPVAGVLVLGRINVPVLLVLSITGFFYPDLWLADKAKKRDRMFLRELPNVLDLLTLCVEAGLDFTAGIGKVVSKSRQGELSDEFSRFLNELRIGKTRKEALEDMSRRVGTGEFSSFTAALIQADEMGTSMGRVLRVQSNELRSKLMLSLEKKAMEAPVKILLPLIGFIFPAIFIIIFGPIILTGIF